MFSTKSHWLLAANPNTHKDWSKWLKIKLSVFQYFKKRTLSNWRWKLKKIARLFRGDTATLIVNSN